MEPTAKEPWIVASGRDDFVTAGTAGSSDGFAGPFIGLGAARVGAARGSIVTRGRSARHSPVTNGD